MILTTERCRNMMTFIQWRSHLLLLLMLMLLWQQQQQQQQEQCSVVWGFVATTTTTAAVSRAIGSDFLPRPSPPFSGSYLTSLCATRDTKTSSTTTGHFQSPSSFSSPKASPKDVLLDLILNQTPAGRATSAKLTQQILAQIRALPSCPTPDDQVLNSLSGTWELLWTAPDPSQPESQRWNNRILNPIEDQSFSNNPEGMNGRNTVGRSNPFLPVRMQNLLEQWGVVPSSATTTTRRRSTQAIDLSTRTIRNIVTIPIASLSSSSVWSSFGASPTTTPQNRRVTLTVTVKLTPVQSDARRINVKFTECRISLPSFSLSNEGSKKKSSNVEYTFPLGLIGPTGWLRTIYIDDTIRITRGHKGSVFVLSRPRRATV